MKILKIIVSAIIGFLIALGCVSFGWNVLLIKVFENVPVLDFYELCLFTLALSFLSAPTRYLKF
jgi:ABC-type amino acid transport system permease subunit